MKVGFSTISFRASETPSQKASAELTERVMHQQEQTQKQEAVKPEKHKSSINEKIANVWKFFASLDELTRAYLRGVFYGAEAGIATAGIAWIFRALPKAFTKEATLGGVIKHPLKHIGKAGKVMAGLAGAGVFAINAIAGHLQKNQRTAVIDHKMKVGHRDS